MMEIKEDHHEDNPTCTTLYEAAVAGSVSCLERLIQKDPLILNKVSLTHLSETPLHISALLGHLDFTKTLLTHNSRLATVRDSLRRPPLLLAAAEGHKETVQALLEAYPDACLFRDQDGSIPLHYAAMRGHAEVLAELLRAKPEAISVLDRGDTVFHLCVRYNQLDCLKLLMEEVEDVTDFLYAGAGSDGGMNILELAVMLRQIETIKYLLSLPTVRSAEAELVNGKVLKMLENSPRDFASLEIRRVLIDAGITTNGRNEHEKLPIPNDISKKEEGEKGARKVKKKQRSKRGNWVEEKRGMLMVAATMISTMTFQAAINPPGGFWQEMNTNTTISGTSYCSETNPCFAGTAVSNYIHPDTFSKFQVYDTICFFSSLCITLLLISGVLIHRRVIVRLMSVVVCLTLIFLTLAFTEGINLVKLKPHLRNNEKSYSEPAGMAFGGAAVTTILVLPLVLVALYNTIPLLVWLVKMLWRLLSAKRKKMTINNNRNPQQPGPITSHEV